MAARFGNSVQIDFLQVQGKGPFYVVQFLWHRQFGTPRLKIGPKIAAQALLSF